MVKWDAKIKQQKCKSFFGQTKKKKLSLKMGYREYQPQNQQTSTTQNMLSSTMGLVKHKNMEPRKIEFFNVMRKKGGSIGSYIIAHKQNQNQSLQQHLKFHNFKISHRKLQGFTNFHHRLKSAKLMATHKMLHVALLFSSFDRQYYK